MSTFEAAILGIVQGLTEFLPVSSSGHLVLGQALLGVELPGVLFEVVVHLATLVAVLWVYRRSVARLAGGVFTGDRDSLGYVGLLVLASVPAAAVGLLAGDVISEGFERPVVAAGLLIVTGLVVYSLRWSAPRATRERPRTRGAFLVGIAQAVAILPGISRSGSTVAAGAALGVEPARIAEFSFLMAVPAIGGAALLQLDGWREGVEAIGPAPLGVGFVAACLSGVIAIRIFVAMLEHRIFHRFAYYCWMAGLLYLGAAALEPGLR